MANGTGNQTGTRPPKFPCLGIKFTNDCASPGKATSANCHATVDKIAWCPSCLAAREKKEKQGSRAPKTQAASPGRGEQGFPVGNSDRFGRGRGE